MVLLQIDLYLKPSTFSVSVHFRVSISQQTFVLISNSYYSD